MSFGLFEFGQGNAIVVFLDGVEMARADNVIDEINDNGSPNDVEIDFNGFDITVRWNSVAVIDQITVLPAVITRATLSISWCVYPPSTPIVCSSSNSRA